MKVKSKTAMNSKESLELAQWLIKRCDNLRASTANRAAIIVSADALLLAGVTFLLGQALTGVNQYSQTEKIVFILSSGANLLLLILSIVYATAATAYVWKTTREVMNLENMPNALFFNLRVTVEKYNQPDFLEEEFVTKTIDQMTTYALREFFLIANSHHKRYRNFRIAIRLLIISIFPFLAALIVLFVGFINA